MLPQLAARTGPSLNRPAEPRQAAQQARPVLRTECTDPSAVCMAMTKSYVIDDTRLLVSSSLVLLVLRLSTPFTRLNSPFSRRRCSLPARPRSLATQHQSKPNQNLRLSWMFPQSCGHTDSCIPRDAYALCRQGLNFEYFLITTCLLQGPRSSTSTWKHGFSS